MSTQVCSSFHTAARSTAACSTAARSTIARSAADGQPQMPTRRVSQVTLVVDGRQIVNHHESFPWMARLTTNASWIVLQETHGNVTMPPSNKALQATAEVPIYLDASGLAEGLIYETQVEVTVYLPNEGDASTLVAHSVNIFPVQMIVFAQVRVPNHATNHMPP